MITREELAQDQLLKTDRAFGALIGLAIGDSFGDAARTAENHLRFGITMDFTSEDSWSTDDTEFGLLTAQALIESQGKLTTEKVVEAWMEYVAKQSEFPRGGSSEIEAVFNLRKGMMPPLSGKFNSYHLSDGAAMRAAPIGIVAAGDVKEAVRLAEIDAAVSHWRDGIWGAQAVAAGVATAMVGGTVDQVLDAALSVVPQDSWFYYTFSKALNIVEDAGTIEDAWTPLHTELWTTYKAVVPEAVSQAFAIYKLSEGDFKRGVIYAGNFGRDADTIGAIVGALLGAGIGASKIPERWVEKTRYPSGTCLQFTKGKDLAKMAADLADLIVVGESEANADQRKGA